MPGIEIVARDDLPFAPRFYVDEANGAAALLTAIGLVAVILLVVAICWNARRRASLTPAERESEDAEREAGDW